MSYLEQPAPKNGKTKIQGEVKTPEVAIEFDEGRPTSIIDISSNTTENEIPTKESAKQDQQEKEKEVNCKTEDNTPKAVSKPEKVAIPVKGTTSWQVDGRISERKHAPPQRIWDRPGHEVPGEST